MLRPSLVALALLFAGACGTSVDDRPPKLEYITQAILAPACGNAECHSSFKRAGDPTKGLAYAFDTVEATRRTIETTDLLTIKTPDDPNPDNTLMVQCLIRSYDRMPWDAPLPDADIDLIREWVSRDAVIMEGQ